jgi:hypothetical protein
MVTAEQEAALEKLIKDWEAQFGELFTQHERWDRRTSGPVVWFAGKLIDLYFRDGHAQVLLEANTGQVKVLKAPNQPRQFEPLPEAPRDTTPWVMGITPLERTR